MASAAANAGATKITVTEAAALAVNDDVLIGPLIGGTGTTGEAAVRRVMLREGSTNTYTLYLDAPLAFYHPAGTDVDQVDTSGAHTTNAADITIDQVPGVYDTVDVPDMAPTFEPRYFLGTQSKRNFFTVLKGQQAFTGSVAGFVLLNGRALRFPFGKVVTSPSQPEPSNNTILLNNTSWAGHKKGDIYDKGN